MNKFIGWYFKQQTNDEFFAFIPALHIGKKCRSASVQVVTKSEAFFAEYPFESFFADKGNLNIRIGNCSFSKKGIEFDIKTDKINLSGFLRFGRLCPIKYDIMGPFKYVPFMECRHSIISMIHSVNGKLSFNDREITINDGIGYIEGDRGRSFPEQYAWTQYLGCEDTPVSLMLSVADIPLYGIKFKGVICVILWEGREYRLATYLGARVVSIENGKITIKQKNLTFTAELLERNELELKAPVFGAMRRFIRENPLCTARYTLMEDQEVIFDFITDRASFEFEYRV